VAERKAIARLLLDGKITVEEGHPALEGKRELLPYEALYLMRRDLLSLFKEDGTEVTQEELISSSPEKFFWQKYVVYEDLRRKGYEVGPSPFPLAFYVRRKGEEVSPTLLYVMVEGNKEAFGSLLSVLQAARSTKKDAILAIVDATGGISYYGAALSRLDKKARVTGPAAHV